jgi:hypothetical protein
MEVLRFIPSAWNIIASDLVPTGSDPYLVAMSINSFNTPFAIGRNGGWTLPLQVLHFDAVRSGMSIAFEWILAEETYADTRIEIEYSPDGLNFSKLATIRVREKKASYRYTGSLTPAIRYSRIRLIDAIGNSVISRVVKISNDDTDIFITSIKPIPVHDLFTAVIVSPLNEKVLILITDILGRIIINYEQELKKGNNIVSLNCNGFAKGTYQLFCIAGTKRTNIYRFNKL